jgi:hypothetical protein
MSSWDLVSNPDWAGRDPSQEGFPLSESACHDRSHFVEIVCRCGGQMHFHESAIRQVPINQGIMSACHGCGDVLTFDAGEVPAMFTRLRREGWIR